MSCKKRVLLSAGGTGGHLLPAQAVALELMKSAEVLFVAADLSKSKYFDYERFPYKEVPSATFSMKKPIKALKGSYKLFSGTVQSRRILADFRPDVVVGFGSFFTFPILTAAFLSRIPIVLHEQNAIPGKVNKLFSPLAKVTAITFPHSAHLIKGKSIHVKFPIKEEIDSEINPWEYFGLSPEKKTLLVFGGSQGALKLNALFLEAAKILSQHFSFQVLHFIGQKESLETVKSTYETLGIPCCIKDFEKRMSLAWQIADLAIVRAGAATIAELIAAEVPAILIPFPFATENHQVKNAEYFVREVGGGSVCLEEKTNSVELASVILKIFKKELEERKKNIQSHKKQLSLQSLAEIILSSCD